jgi:hypothetical protein
MQRKAVKGIINKSSKSSKRDKEIKNDIVQNIKDNEKEVPLSPEDK